MTEAKTTLFTLTRDQRNETFSSLEAINEFINPLGVEFHEYVQPGTETTYLLGFIGHSDPWTSWSGVALHMETLLEMTLDELLYFVTHGIIQFLLKVRNNSLDDRFIYSSDIDDYHWADENDIFEWPLAIAHRFCSLGQRLVMPIEDLKHADAD